MVEGADAEGSVLDEARAAPASEPAAESSEPDPATDAMRPSVNVMHYRTTLASS
ncbi:hypothetical protein [Streptomyces sp. NPDC006285]|uniref:hypothetical protein n=1 Tax=Streptomyces sp. NPDC006285 TaxID=3364742 RepID=UPI0036B75BCE